MQKSFTLFLISSAIFGLVVLISFCIDIFITWKAVQRSTRSIALPRFKVALFGGIFFTLGPFWFLMFPIFQHNSWLRMSHESFLSFLGPFRFTLSWVPDFLIGFAVFGVIYSIISKRTLTAKPNLVVKEIRE